MSESMIERVARALRQHDCDEVLKRDNVSIPDWESDPDLERRESYRRSARAAIEAMREPTAEIGQAIYAAWDKFGEDAIMGPEEAIAIYRAAIDAALEENENKW